MASSSAIHIISKSNHKDHHVISYSQDGNLPLLQESSIRVKCTILAITGNTYTYARGGNQFHWWDAYPVPEDNGYDRAQWGIVPTWGFAEVLESRISAIRSGSRMFGFWPTADIVVDLHLEQDDGPDYWRDVSPERATLMNIYNRYSQVEAVRDLEKDGITAGCKPVWQAGWLLSRCVFAPGEKAAIHPLGGEFPWTENDADLSAAVVVSLSASTKTGQAFGWALRNRDHRRDGPRALLEVTSNVGALCRSLDERFPAQRASYDDIMGVKCLDWILEHSPKRIVIVDFGAASDTLASFVESVRSHVGKVPFTVVGVGGQTKVQDASGVRHAQAVGADVGKIPMNTSGLVDKFIALEGAAKVFGELEAAWSRAQADSLYANQRINWFEGVNGMQEAWSGLLAGEVSGTSFAGVKLG